MNDAVRRWLSIDGLLTVLLAVNWLWFVFLLVTVTWPFLIPETSESTWPSTIESAPSSSGPSPLQIQPTGAAESANDNPVLFALVLCLTTGSILVTLADGARRRGQRPMVLLCLGGCALAGLGFVAIQLYRFAEPSFISAGDFRGLLLLDSANSISLNLLAGLGLLLISTVLMLVRRSGEVPSLGEQVSAWHWHALDTFWLVLVALAWHWGVMESL